MIHCNIKNEHKKNRILMLIVKVFAVLIMAAMLIIAGLIF